MKYTDKEGFLRTQRVWNDELFELTKYFIARLIRRQRKYADIF
jgi:hypothetical protein